jgi:hypothetical protein
MARVRYPVFITVEEKEDVTGEGIVPELPPPGVLDRQLTDTLADVTNHDGLIGWRVISVEGA